MNNPRADCPSFASLLCARDGAFDDPADTAAGLQHLDTCAACRARVEEHEAFIATGQRLVRERQLAVAHRAMRTEQGLARLALAVRELSERQQLGRRWTRWTAAALLIGALLVGRAIRPTEVVPTANDLLIWALQEERDNSNATQVRIQLRPEAGDHSSAPSLEAGVTLIGGRAAGATVLPSRIVTVLRDAGISPEQPLSIAAFQAWRQSAPARRDRVTVSGDLLILETWSRGRVPMAALRLQRASYRIVGQTWVLAGIGRLDIEARRGGADSEPQPARRETRPTIVTAGAPPRVDAADALARAELTARQLLHELGRDDTLAVAADQAEVRIRGAVRTVDDKRRVERQLEAVPQVVVDLRVAALPGTPAINPLPRWDGRPFGADAHAAFATGLQQDAYAVERGLIAARRLAERYTPAVVDTLSPAARAQLKTLLGRQLIDWRTDLLNLDARLMLLTGVTGRCALVTTVPADWRARVRTSVDDSHTVRSLLDETLQGDTLSSDAPSTQALARSLDRLWSVWCDARQ